MADRDLVVAKLAELQRDFAKLVRRIDQDELDSAVVSARSIANNLNSLLESIQADFANDFKTYRFRTLSSDLESIQKFEATAPKRENLAELAAVASHFFKHVRAVETLVKLAYPSKPFSIRPLINRYGKKVGAGAGAALILFLLVSGIQSYRSRRIGLAGRYFSDTALKTPSRERNDARINFNWGRGSPFRGWRSDFFSIRWTGYLYVPIAGKWELTTYSDDGVRLYVGDKLVISNWNEHSVAKDTAELQLKEGYYPIKLEYYDERLDAIIKLLWKQTDEENPVVIPSSNLFPSARYLQPGLPVFEILDQDAIISTPSIPPVVAAPPVAAPVEAPKEPAHKSAPKSSSKSSGSKTSKAAAPQK